MAISNRLSAREMRLYSIMVARAGETVDVREIADEFFRSEPATGDRNPIAMVNAIIREINRKLNGSKIERTSPNGRGNTATYIMQKPKQMQAIED